MVNVKEINMDFVEILNSGINWFITINANSFFRVCYFIKLNLAFVIFLYLIYYVYKKRCSYIRNRVIRLTKRVSSSQKINIDERKLTVIEQDEFDEKQNKIIFKYILIVGLTLWAVLLTSHATLYAALFIWIVGAIAIKYLKGDFNEIADDLENYGLCYPVTILVICFFIIISSSGINDVSSTIGRAMHRGVMQVTTGYFPMLLGVAMFGFPLMFANLIRQKWTLLFGNDDTKVLIRNQLRTGNQSEMLPNTQNETSPRKRRRL